VSGIRIIVFFLMVILSSAAQVFKQTRGVCLLLQKLFHLTSKII
jgi:hypothetical protein